MTGKDENTLTALVPVPVEYIKDEAYDHLEAELLPRVHEAMRMAAGLRRYTEPVLVSANHRAIVDAEGNVQLSESADLLVYEYESRLL